MKWWTQLSQQLLTTIVVPLLKEVQICSWCFFARNTCQPQLGGLPPIFKCLRSKTRPRLGGLNDQRRPGFSIQGAWIRVFRHLKYNQTMEKGNVRYKSSILFFDMLVNKYCVSFGFNEFFCSVIVLIHALLLSFCDVRWIKRSIQFFLCSASNASLFFYLRLLEILARVDNFKLKTLSLGGELWIEFLSRGFGSLTPNFCFRSKFLPHIVGLPLQDNIDGCIRHVANCSRSRNIKDERRFVENGAIESCRLLEAFSQWVAHVCAFICCWVKIISIIVFHVRIIPSWCI